MSNKTKSRTLKKCPAGKRRSGKSCKNTKGKCPKGSHRSKSGKSCIKTK